MQLVDGPGYGKIEYVIGRVRLAHVAWLQLLPVAGVSAEARRPRCVVK